MSQKNIAILIDGGFLRATAKKAKKKYDSDFISQFAEACRHENESIFRILYYDCAYYSGTVRLPISGKEHEFKANDEWLHGFKPKQTPVPPKTATDEDFEPIFEQKGVDMRIGLDIAAFSHNRAVERIVLVSADTDCVPALKYARKSANRPDFTSKN